MDTKETIDMLCDFDVALFDNGEPTVKNIEGVLYISPNFGPTPNITIKASWVEVE
jgi:hypothetical protein